MANECSHLFKDNSSPYRPLLSQQSEVVKELYIDKEAYPQKNLQEQMPKSIIRLDKDYERDIQVKRKILQQDIEFVYAKQEQRNFKLQELEAAMAAAKSLAQENPKRFRLRGYTLKDLATGESINLQQRGKSPLKEIARFVTEDMILVSPNRQGEYILRSGVLAFPSNWYLRDFLGASMKEIHQGLSAKGELGSIIDRILQRLPEGESIRRNNWFLTENPLQAQSAYPSYGKAYDSGNIHKNNVMNKMFFRSEYQTLSKLPSGAVLFTIKVYTFSLNELVKIDGMAEKILRGFVIKQNALKETLPRYYHYLIVQLAKNTSYEASTYKKVLDAIKKDLN
tara:strand:+ start:21625 stop:22638 length:1014 start_codon:yes stop_codon:yes gene_type:complete